MPRDQTARRRVATLAARLDRRTGEGDALGRIQIPKLGIKFVFVAGAGSQSLKKGPGHYDATALPGEQGTVGIAGHRTTYLAPFRNLQRLRRGDEITLTMPYGRFAYTVKGSLVVSPSRIAVLRSLAHDRLVLTTCTPPFSAAKRLVVIARERSQVPLGAAVGDPFPYRPRSSVKDQRTRDRPFSGPPGAVGGGDLVDRSRSAHCFSVSRS